LPGMTGRAVRALQERLGIEDVEALRCAAQNGSLWREKWTPAVREAIERAKSSLLLLSF
jgi:ribosomal protein S5